MCGVSLNNRKNMRAHYYHLKSQFYTPFSARMGVEILNLSFAKCIFFHWERRRRRRQD